jgi:tetratricopeptide (TPR) repeat protein
MGNDNDSLKQQIYASMDMKDTHELLAIWETNDRESWSDETFEAIQAVLQNRRVEIPDLQMMLRHFDLANEYHQNNQDEEALAECDQMIESTPDWSPAHNLRGVILEELDKEDEAIEEYREAIRIDPDNDDAKENLVYAEDYVEAHRDSFKQPEQKTPNQSLYPSKGEAFELSQPEKPGKGIYVFMGGICSLVCIENLLWLPSLLWNEYITFMGIPITDFLILIGSVALGGAIYSGWKLFTA